MSIYKSLSYNYTMQVSQILNLNFRLPKPHRKINNLNSQISTPSLFGVQKDCFVFSGAKKREVYSIDCVSANAKKYNSLTSLSNDFGIPMPQVHTYIDRKSFYKGRYYFVNPSDIETNGEVDNLKLDKIIRNYSKNLRFIETYLINAQNGSVVNKYDSITSLVQENDFNYRAAYSALKNRTLFDDKYFIVDASDIETDNQINKSKLKNLVRNYKYKKVITIEKFSDKEIDAMTQDINLDRLASVYEYENKNARHISNPKPVYMVDIKEKTIVKKYPSYAHMAQEFNSQTCLITVAVKRNGLISKRFYPIDASKIEDDGKINKTKLINVLKSIQWHSKTDKNVLTVPATMETYLIDAKDGKVIQKYDSRTSLAQAIGIPANSACACLCRKGMIDKKYFIVDAFDIETNGTVDEEKLKVAVKTRSQKYKKYKTNFSEDIEIKIDEKKLEKIANDYEFPEYRKYCKNFQPVYLIDAKTKEVIKKYDSRITLARELEICDSTVTNGIRRRSLVSRKYYIIDAGDIEVDDKIDKNKLLEVLNSIDWRFD